jgi:hypothetical protein
MKKIISDQEYAAWCYWMAIVLRSKGNRVGSRGALFMAQRWQESGEEASRTARMTMGLEA